MYLFDNSAQEAIIDACSPKQARLKLEAMLKKDFSAAWVKEILAGLDANPSQLKCLTAKEVRNIRKNYNFLTK